MAVLILLACSTAGWSQKPAPQYRHRNQSIPAATADEPIRSEFSAAALRKHVDQAADLWARQKQCVSCHTHGIYVYVRPQLNHQWGAPAGEVRQFLVDQVNQRLQEGDVDDISGKGQLAYMSRGLAAWDAVSGDATSPETDRALRYLVNEFQADDGSIVEQYRFPPINSDTYHTTIAAALAMGTAPGWYRSLTDMGTKAGVDRLLNHLKQTVPKHDHQRLLLLWASTVWPKLLSKDQRHESRSRIWELQRPDGGWSIRTFAEPEQLGNRAKAKALRAEPGFDDPTSDGYQTALCIIVLRDAGVPAADPRIQKGINWLKSNQRETGRWWTKSLNTTSRFHYVSYSGTAYAALALAKCNALETVNGTD